MLEQQCVVLTKLFELQVKLIIADDSNVKFLCMTDVMLEILK